MIDANKKTRIACRYKMSGSLAAIFAAAARAMGLSGMATPATTRLVIVASR
jgi:hypothetical protein